MSLVRCALIVLAFTLATGSTASADESNKVPYKGKVSAKVGDQIVIHGLRGECGEMPTAAEVTSMEKKYSSLPVGKIVAGSPGVRNSKSCNGNTPVIEAVFVAEKQGRVKFELFGDPIQITVR